MSGYYGCTFSDMICIQTCGCCKDCIDTCPFKCGVYLHNKHKEIKKEDKNGTANRNSTRTNKTLSISNYTSQNLQTL